MALQTANQFQLGTDFSQLGRGVAQGQQIGAQFQQAQQRKQAIGQSAEQARILSVVQGASEIHNIPTDSLKLDALVRRKGELLQQGLPTQDTDEVINLFNAGKNEEANALIKGVVDAGIQQGLLKTPSAVSGLTSEQREFAGLTKDLTPEQVKDARLIELGLKARAGSSKEERLGLDEQLTRSVAESQAVIEKKKSAAKETGKLSAQLNLKPEVDAAVVTAVAQAKFDADIKIENRSNQKAFDVYNAAKSNLVSALGGTITGPGAGWIPALTADAQIANGAVAMMAPVLKQLFRASGEGTFTDKDQEMLIAMVPTRDTLPEARVVQLAAIDSIVSAKLGTISEEAKEKTGQKKTAQQPVQGGVKFLGFE